MKEEEKEIKKPSLKGVEGWLLFFIISLVFITPILNIGLIFVESYAPIDIFATLAIMSLSITAGIFLWTEKPYAVKFAKVYLITTLIYQIGLSLIAHDFSLLRFVIYFIIWITYLGKSERVRQTYGSLKEKTGGYSIWAIMAIIYAFISPVYGGVFAIISLIEIKKNHRPKGTVLSILALLASLIVILLFFMIIGLSYIPPDIEQKCINFCESRPYEGGYSYIYPEIQYDPDKEEYVCYCKTGNGSLIAQKSFHEE